jgi:hypothetical protein
VINNCDVDHFVRTLHFIDRVGDLGKKMSKDIFTQVLCEEIKDIRKLFNIFWRAIAENDKK